LIDTCNVKAFTMQIFVMQYVKECEQRLAPDEFLLNVIVACNCCV
jgi:hypothetical protein